MIDKREFNLLKEEHNKVAGWTKYFSSKIHELDKKIKHLEKSEEARIQKEKIIGKSILKLMKENQELKKHLGIIPHGKPKRKSPTKTTKKATTKRTSKSKITKVVPKKAVAKSRYKTTTKTVTKTKTIRK